jgi:hypothetical protein
MYWAPVKNPHVAHSPNNASLDTNVKATGTLEQKPQREGRTRKEKNPEKVGVTTLHNWIDIIDIWPKKNSSEWQGLKNLTHNYWSN